MIFSSIFFLNHVVNNPIVSKIFGIFLSLKYIDFDILLFFNVFKNIKINILKTRW